MSPNCLGACSVLAAVLLGLALSPAALIDRSLQHAGLADARQVRHRRSTPRRTDGHKAGPLPVSRA